MKNDGKCYLWIPSYLTLSVLSSEAATAINNVHTILGLQNDYVAGQQNPYILLLNDLDMGGAPFTRGSGSELAVCGPIENVSFLTIEYISLIVMFGGECEGLPVWFEIDDITEDCPFSDSETWETWGIFGESHIPIQIGDKWYRSNAVGQTGELLLASQWVGLGLTAITKSSYLELLNNTI